MSILAVHAGRDSCRADIKDHLILARSIILPGKLSIWKVSIIMHIGDWKKTENYICSYFTIKIWSFNISCDGGA